MPQTKNHYTVLSGEHASYVVEKSLTKSQKKIIEDGVRKIVKGYGNVLRKLGQEQYVS